MQYFNIAQGIRHGVQPMSQTTTRYASYKSKTYRCLYTGQTKFGRKAKLAFLDGSKEFWVDLSLVTVDVPAPTSSRSGGYTAPARSSGRSSYPRTGCSCGSRDGITQEGDCWQCRHDAE